MQLGQAVEDLGDARQQLGVLVGYRGQGQGGLESVNRALRP